MSGLYQVVAKQFRSIPDKAFLQTETRALSYGELEEKTAQVVSLFRALRLGAGSRVLYQSQKCIEAVVLYLGALRAGLVFVPVNNAYTDAELNYFIEDAEPNLVICEPERATAIAKMLARAGNNHLLTLDGHGQGTLTEALSKDLALTPDIEVSDSDLAAIIYTSGTTGHPKGAMLSHGNLLSNAITLHKIWGWQKNDVLLHTLPINHVHGLFVAIHCALLGPSTVLFHSGFNVDKALASLSDATVFMGVPTYYTRLLKEPTLNQESLRGMRLFISGSAPLSENTLHDFESRTGHRILERYGMTETGMIASNPLAGIRQAGTVGQPLPGVEVRLETSSDNPEEVDNPAILEVRGESVFSGYWRRPEQTKKEFTQDGWFRTGDLACVEEGTLRIVGRVKDMVITGGLNVYPKEIERLLDGESVIDESAVFGVPHADFGEAVVATCVLKPGQSLDNDDITSRLKTMLASYKVPKRVLIEDRLPRNAMGKVQKNVLRAKYSELFVNKELR